MPTPLPATNASGASVLTPIVLRAVAQTIVALPRHECADARRRCRADAGHPPWRGRSLQQEATDADFGWACFGGYSAWEVVVGRQKIVGLAQVRKRTGTLLVAGLLLERPHWEWLGEVLQKPPSDIVALAAA